jgi:TolB-like protein/tRNA A-37 threonylcarbamoyl transferase component Bud32
MKNSDGPSASVVSALASSSKCEKCGGAIRLETGVCATCLLREGLESGVSRAAFESVMAEDRVPDGEWYLGNYEILDEIGRGGMGVIYRARQRHSRRIVAVKRVLSYQAESHETLERFRREAEAVASLDHPNILAIYEVSESEDGLPFFSMKFATGGSLQNAVSAFRDEPRKCVQLMAKVARAVEYAHNRGVLHRDLKPGNILLDDRGEPLVSDFGLAKWLNTNTDLTKSLITFGTAGYIAPEQAEGAAADLTPAADIYSLGAILFGLLAGRPPFLGDNALSVIRQAVEKPAPKLRALAPSYNRDLETICARCLERDAKARYQSAGDLATDLERWLEGLPIVARPVSLPARIWRWSRRNPKLVGAGVAGLLLGAAALGGYAFLVFPSMWGGSARHGSISEPEKSIAILPFANLSHDPADTYLTEGIQEQILTRLAKIADLKVVPRTSTQGYPTKPDNLSKVAKQLGVTNILEGSVQKEADRVLASVQLVNAQTNSNLWTEKYDRKLTDVFGIESEIAVGVAQALQARLSSSEEQALSAKATANPEAYDAYLRGVAFQGRVRTSNNLLLKAIGYFEQAVKLDPNFAAAWARLSRTRAYLYFRANAVHPDSARDALEHAQKLEPNSPETLLALGYYQYWVLGDYGHAKATFQLVYKLSPIKGEAAYALSVVNRREGNWDECITWLGRALALDPGNGELIMKAAWTYGMLRQFPKALKLYDRALDIVTNDPDLMSFEASVYQAQGDLEKAAKLLSDVTAETPFDGAFSIKLLQLRLERNYTEAIRLLQARLAQFQFSSEFNKATAQVELALTQRLAGDIAGAKLTAEQARNTLEPLSKNQPDNYNFPVWLGLANAILGEKDAALAEAERAVMLLRNAKDAVDGPGTEENLAFVETFFGGNSRAISILGKLLQTPFHSLFYGPAPLTPALLGLDPFWDPLRADPAFQELCDKKQR